MQQHTMDSPRKGDAPEQVTLEVPAGIVSVHSRGTVYRAQRSAYPEHILLALIDHAIGQKLSDSASQVFADVWKEKKGPDAKAPSREQRDEFSERYADEIAQATLAQIAKADDALLRGDWTIRQAGGTVTRATPQENLALQMAQTALALRFGAAAIKLGLHKGEAARCPAATMAELGDKPAEFFDLGGKRVTWNKARLQEFIRDQAEAGTRDFMTEAQAELDRQAELASEIVAEADAFDDL